MKRFPTNLVLAVAARWGAWLLTVGLLWSAGAFAQLRTDARPLLFLGYTTLYALIWTRYASRSFARTPDVSRAVFTDLFLSMLPVWLSGGWASPFLPFALGALVLPALSRSWRGGILIAAAFLAIDQIILWTTPTNPWQLANDGQSLALLARTLLPFGVAASVCATHDTWRWAQRYARRRVRPSVPPRRDPPPVRSLLDPPQPRRSGSFSRATSDEPLTRTWAKERGIQPTLERRSSPSIHAALHQIKPEFASANVALLVETKGDERVLTPQVHDLVIRALEIALDNVIVHAHAHTATVRIEVTEHAILLNVLDDGVGLFDGTAEPPGFHQIKRLRFRAQELGGELRVVERDGGGVAFDLRVPHIAAER